MVINETRNDDEFENGTNNSIKTHRFGTRAKPEEWQWHRNAKALGSPETGGLSRQLNPSDSGGWPAVYFWEQFDSIQIQFAPPKLRGARTWGHV